LLIANGREPSIDPCTFHGRRATNGSPAFVDAIPTGRGHSLGIHQ
jgi:hypothetical protein